MARLSIFLALLLDAASAHTIMNRISAGGVTYPQGAGIYMPSNDAYQPSVTSNTIACNGAPVTGFTSSNQVISVKAGDTITGAWLHTLSSTGPDSAADNKVIDSSHKGPVLAYLKKVTDATQNPSAGPGNGWFKIAEEGLISSSQWGVDKLIANGGIQSVTIPSCIASGDYLLRLEIIALHSAYAANGAQFYMECAQLRITGSSSPVTPTTYSIPGIYSATDPGILISIYGNSGQPYPTSGKYTIPGPPVFQCGAGSAAPAAAAPAAAKPAASSAAASSKPAAAAPTKVAVSSAAPAKASSAAVAPVAASSAAAAPAYSAPAAAPAPAAAAPAAGCAVVAKYGRCGGQGYTGSTTCALGSTCKYSNTYYSQCV